MTKPRHGPLMAGEPVQLTDPKGRSHIITLRAGASFHTHRGTLSHDDIIGGPDGNVVRSGGGTPYVVFRPLLADYTLTMKRGAAVVYPKDAAQIVAFADVFPGARVLEAGAGSGALSCWLLRAIGEQGTLVSFERRPDFAEIARRNVEQFFGGPPPAWQLVNGEFGADFDGLVDFDRVILDMLAPWDCVDAAAGVTRARRPGLLLRGHHHTAVPHRRGPARARRLRRACRLGEPGPRVACGRPGRAPGAPHGGTHRLPGHRAAAGAGRGSPAPQAPSRRGYGGSGGKGSPQDRGGPGGIVPPRNIRPRVNGNA